VQPPQRRLLSSEQISKREYLFILDVSGSMTGYPIDLSKQLMTKLLKENVREGDSLNILLFAGGSAVLSEGGNVEATKQSVEDRCDKSASLGHVVNIRCKPCEPVEPLGPH